MTRFTFTGPAALRGAAVASLFVAIPARADLVGYYVGVDNRDTIGYSQPGSGQPSQTYANPNDNGLTLLYQHGDHFHGIGVHSYTGPTGSPTAVDTSANNRLPEISSGQAPLRLLPAPAGHPLAGRWVSGLGNEPEYADLEIRSFESLFGFPAGSPEQVLASSSGGRWNTDLTGSAFGLQLVSISPGLAVADQAGTTVLDGPGDVYTLGAGDAFTFEPVFHAAADAPFGTYSAEFRLIDQRAAGTGEPFGSSGRFSIDVAVPEPASAATCALALGALAARGRRLRRACRTASTAD